MANTGRRIWPVIGPTLNISDPTPSLAGTAETMTAEHAQWLTPYADTLIYGVPMIRILNTYDALAASQQEVERLKAENANVWDARAALPPVPEKPQEAVAWVPDEMDVHQVVRRLHKDGIHFSEGTVGRVLLCVADYLGPSVIAHPISPALVGDEAPRPFPDGSYEIPLEQSE